MVRIGYGKAHFPDLIEEKKHYIDRTDYIERLENSGESFVFFLRPRRFGKSLWVSILRHYYDIRFKDQFDTLFGNYYIGTHPTPYANKYLILSFDFSGIDSESRETLYHDFSENIRRSISVFLADYKSLFSEEEAQNVLVTQSSYSFIDNLFSLIKSKKLTSKLYILIDEYDHFANQLIANQLSDFKEIVSKASLIHGFYETLQTAAGEGLIERLFITGVSPITLDSLTSGFNIATNLSLNHDFHNMMGFTNAEVRNLLELMNVEGQELDDYNNLLKNWYAGYKFNPEAPDFIYNPTIILYFASHFNRLHKPPSKMSDKNVVSSYGRIRALFRLSKQDNEFDNLYALLENGEVSVKMTQIFNFDVGFTRDDFFSLLFYMGFLTIKQEHGLEYILKMPNRVIEQLYHKYFIQLLSEKTNFAKGVDTLEDALNGLLYHNNPTLIANLITYTLTNLSGRDATVPLEIREKNVQVLLFSFLSFSESYLVETEYNAQGQYFDILATNISVHQLDYNFLFELKYLPKASAKTVKAEYIKAQAQIARYQQTPKAQAVKNLKSWIMIVVGTEVKICKEA
jgi:Predicted AAA-ATPase/PD-(D/E)XK nuclease superfamily